MVKYRVPQSEIDEDNKNKVLGMIKHYTIKEGGVDLDKLSPATFLSSSYGITLEGAKEVLQALISEGKVEKVQ